jgi:hypothetical protein
MIRDKQDDEPEAVWVYEVWSSVAWPLMTHRSIPKTSRHSSRRRDR